MFGSEIARGFDAFALTQSDLLSQDEFDAAREVQVGEFNAQLQSELTAAPSFAVVRARFDQAVRADAIDDRLAAQVAGTIDRAERLKQRRAAVARLENAARSLSEAPYQRELSEALEDLAATLP